MSRVTIPLRDEERKALLELALSELPRPADQARFILRKELERRGLLPAAAKSEQPEADHAEPPTLTRRP